MLPIDYQVGIEALGISPSKITATNLHEIAKSAMKKFPHHSKEITFAALCLFVDSCQDEQFRVNFRQIAFALAENADERLFRQV